MREMQSQILKDAQGMFELLSVHIINYQQQWNSEAVLCPMGCIKNVGNSGKHLLSLQMVQSSLM